MEFNRSKIASFQEQNCQLTLREAIEEFYSINSGFFSRPESNTIWTELLVHHDVGHVFFGVNTSLMDEACGDFWTMFATDMSIKEYSQYAKTPEGKKLLKYLGFNLLVKTMLLTIPLMFKVFIQSRKMNKKWEVRGYEQFLDMPLGEVRKIHNLTILSY